MTLREYLESELGVEVRDRDSVSEYMASVIEQEMEGDPLMASLSAVMSKASQRQRRNGTLREEYVIEDSADISVRHIEEVTEKYFISQEYGVKNGVVKAFYNEEEVLTINISRGSAGILISVVG